MSHNLRLQEEYSAKIPALTLLSAMGWRYIAPHKVFTMRENKNDNLLLKPLLIAHLQKYRFTFQEKSHALDPDTIERLIGILERPDFTSGLLKANENITHHLLYGIGISQFVEGTGKAALTVPLIDWEQPENNDFAFTEEFPVARTQGNSTCRPDIVCFVNGIPLAVIEAKRPDSKTGKPTVKEGISQNLRNQKATYIPKFFAYLQLLMSISGTEAAYGTVGSKEKFWSSWREEKISREELTALKNKSLSSDQKEAILSERQPAKKWFENYISRSLIPDGQDEALVGLLSPDRFLKLIRFYTLFDQFKGKIIARPHQIFGIEGILERLKTKSENPQDRSGVVWQTTGSGKSLTMVLFAHALKLDPALKQSRLIIITDRTDLEKQLSDVFFAGDAVGKHNRGQAKAKTGRDLARKISKGQDRIIFSLIQKFNSAVELETCYNPDPNLIVLVDEARRTQGGAAHQKMRKALPNAALIAFTGTPLLKKQKTARLFGKIIHAYTMKQAVEDKIVTPLLYEERKPDLEINARPIDRGVEKLTASESEAFTAKVKKNFSKPSEIFRAKDRIRLVAEDIAEHLETKIPSDLKGMLCCDSKLSAILYQKEFQRLDQFKTVVVMSPPDTREGHGDIDEDDSPDLQKWWQETVGSKEETKYTNEAKAQIAEDPEVRLLIVVDKLLTGFDEPKIGVLYIDKQLTDHNLLQAIARTNRLHESKLNGLLIDYRGILSELDKALKNYDEHARNQDGLHGFDAKDLEGIYQKLADEYKKLPDFHAALWAVFEGVENKSQMEQLRAVLSPNLVAGEDLNEAKREAFFKALSDFATCLTLANQSTEYFNTPLEERTEYNKTLKQMDALRKIVRQDCGLTIDFTRFEKEMRRLIHQNVSGVEIEEAEGFYEVTRDPSKMTPEGLENEARAMRTQLTKKIEELADDPYAKAYFSDLLKAAIEESKSRFEDPLKKFLKFKSFQEKFEKREMETIPAPLKEKPKPRAYYGIFLQALGDKIKEKETGFWIGLTDQVEKVIEKANAEHSLNPENRKKEIHRQLLPMFVAKLQPLGVEFSEIQEIITKMSDLPA
ncbi:type I restriction endonuclease subunit R [Acetobacteraceae bacterium]|nr:type I restriction endonuclease subunit R [Acetobacteraceae bacterium]